MQGRITSEDPGLNKYGVPYAQVLMEERKAHARHVAALVNALDAWRQWDKARKKVIEMGMGKPAPVNAKDLKTMYEMAVEMTNRALR